MAENKYSKYVKGTADKPKRRHVDFKEGEKGYELIGKLQDTYNGEGIRTIIADALEQVVNQL